jgi:hypothetical protein
MPAVDLRLYIGMTCTIQRAEMCSAMTVASDQQNYVEGRHSFNLVLCGLVSGVIQGVVLNPWDQALYLSIKVTDSGELLHFVIIIDLLPA